jgi:predicted amidohydrolase
VVLTGLALHADTARAGQKEANITLVQLTTRNQSADSIIERMPRYFREASAYGSDLIVFPEYVLGHMITVDHPRVQAFFDLAREHRMYAIAGLVEKTGDRWATTALVVDR